MPRTLAARMLDALEGARDPRCSACGCRELRAISSVELCCLGCGTVALVTQDERGDLVLTWNRAARPDPTD